MFIEPTVPTEIAELTVGQVVSVVLFLAAIIGAIVTLVKKLKPWADALHNFFDDWNGVSDRPGVEGHLGVMQRLENLESDNKELRKEVAEIKGEVKPNHGNSLNDKVSRIEAVVNQRNPND